MNCRIADLAWKEVISVTDGSRLGYTEDVEFDLMTGQICAIVVAGAGRFFGLFGQRPEHVIPWDCIKRFGEDIILVEVRGNCCGNGGCTGRPRERRKKRFF